MPQTETVHSPITGTVDAISARPGQHLEAGATLLVLESMKMEHPVPVGQACMVTTLLVEHGQAVKAGDPLATVEAQPEPGSTDQVPDPAPAAAPEPAPSQGRAIASERPAGEPPRRPPTAQDTGAAPEVEPGLRADLAEVIARHAQTLDAARPQAVAKRHGRGQRTAREDIKDLVDQGSLVEYAPLVVAAQKRRRSIEDLRANTPADGLVGGLATVEGRPVVVASYDYMVLAGTQGLWNHRKKDRLFEIAEAQRLPVILFAEGGGGRPGDTDGMGPTGLDCLAFMLFARLSGRVPLVGVVTGRCFAGNAALLGCCDVIIATEGTNLGMGGPAMIEGGGLGVFTPEEVGPVSVQNSNGVIDVLVSDQAAAVATAKQYLSYFYQDGVDLTGPPARRAQDLELREVIPENRRRIYDIRTVVTLLADRDSVLELRAGYAPGLITALVRIEGAPVALIANNPAVAGGAITGDCADKASRFLGLADAFDLPVVSLCDTPGFMVGPEAEETALVRRVTRMFVVGANLEVPFVTVVLRKGYGLGAQSMAAGSFRAPTFTVGWPTSEFGGMGLEGAVRLGYRKELEAVDDPEEREALFQQMVARSYEVGKGTSIASMFEIDDVIDPADTRKWICGALRSAPPVSGWRARSEKKRAWVSTW